MRKFFTFLSLFIFFCLPSFATEMKTPSPSNQSISSNNKDTAHLNCAEPKEKKEEKKDTLSVLADIGTFGSFIVAIAAAIYALIQYIISKKENRRAQAYQNYSTFLQMAFDNPEFSNPSQALLQVKDHNNLKYKYFVANMLFAFEQIFLAVGNEKDWRAVMKGQLNRHAFYLKGSGTLKNEHWNKKFEDFIRESI